MRAKTIRETLNEFHKTGDPLKSLSVGVTNMTIFDSREEFAQWVVFMLPFMLGTKNIPEDIIDTEEYLINQPYFVKMCQFLSDKRFTVSGYDYKIDLAGYVIPEINIRDIPMEIRLDENLWYLISNILRNMGFKD